MRHMAALAAITRFSLMGESPNTLACWSGLLFFLTYFHLGKRPRLRLAACSVFLFVIALTQSRSAILLVISIWALVFFIERKIRIPPKRAILCLLLAGSIVLGFIGLNGRWGTRSLQDSLKLRANITQATLMRAAEKFMGFESAHGLAYDAHVRYGIAFSREQIQLITRPLSSVLQLLTELPPFFGAAACAILFTPPAALFLALVASVRGNAPRSGCQTIPSCVSFFVGCGLINDLNQDYSGRLLSVLILLLATAWIFWPKAKSPVRWRLPAASLGCLTVLLMLLSGLLFTQKSNRERHIAHWHTEKHEGVEGIAYYWAGSAVVSKNLLILDYGGSEALSLQCVVDGCQLIGAGWGLFHVKSPVRLQDFYLDRVKGKPLFSIILNGGIPERLKIIAMDGDKFLMINPQEVNAIPELSDGRVSFLFTEKSFLEGSEDVFSKARGRITTDSDLFGTLQLLAEKKS